MAVSFRSASQASADLVSSFVVSKPLGATAGDVLVAVMFSDSPAQADMAAPGDWTEAGQNSRSGNRRAKVWYKPATVAEPGTYTFATNPAATAVLFVLAFSGADAAVPLGVLSFGGDVAVNTGHIAPSVTPTVADSMLVCAWSGQAATGTRTYIPAVGTTEVGDIASATWQFGAIAYQTLGATGATGSRVATSGQASVSHTVSLTITPGADTGGLPTVPEEVTAWIDADGGITPLDVEWNVSGRFAPPAEFEEEGVPTQPGTRLRDVRHAPREFVLPIWIEASTPAELRALMRDLVAKMDPARGDGKIRVTSTLGDQREITCRVPTGMGMNEALGEMSGPTVQRATPVFRAVDPYWYAVSEVNDTFALGTPPSFFPFFPLRLSASEVFVDADIVNIGDVVAWPVWTVFGPGSGITLRNLVTDTVTTLSTVLQAGEHLVIDTRPGAKTVTKSDGTNVFPDLSVLSSLWSLRVGANVVRIEMTGTTPASSIRVRFKPRFLSA